MSILATIGTYLTRGRGVPSRASSAAVAIRTSSVARELEAVARDMEKMSLQIDGLYEVLSGNPPAISIAISGSTGSGTPIFGSNCPATTLASPFTWIQATLQDGTVVYIPAWK